MSEKTKNIYLGKYKKILEDISSLTGQTVSKLLRTATEEYVIPLFKEKKGGLL
jgi:hypothetical protein